MPLNSKVRLTQLPVKVALNIFDAAILPILLYGSEIWEPYPSQENIKWESNDIEKVHTQYIKRILGLNRSTTNMLVRTEGGRFSLQTKALQRNIKNRKYLRSKSNDELAKHAILYEQTKSTSRATIESSILKKLNAVGNQQYRQFKQFKNRVKFENYLTDVTNRKHRAAMSKLRTSDHKLMIEQGRRQRPKNRKVI